MAQNGETVAITLEDGARDYWGLKGDLMQPSPLSFEEPIDFQVLVETRIVNAMRGIRKQLESSTMSKIWLLFGIRGSGKTSAMRFLGNLVSMDQEFAFVECPVYLDTTNINEFRRHVNISLLRGMKEYLLEKEIIDGGVSQEVDRVIDDGSLQTIVTKLGSIFKILCSAFPRRIIFMDDLDKVDLDPAKQEMLRQYFAVEQSVYNIFTKKYNTFIFIALQELPGVEFTRDKDLNYLAGNALHVKHWTDIELDNMISKRLQNGYTRGHFDLNKIITSKARIMVYNHNRYNPRWSLLALRYLLQKAFEENKSTISDEFCHQHTDGLQIIRGGGLNSEQNYDILDGQIKSLFKGANSRVENVIRKHKSNRFGMVQTLVWIFKNREIENRVALNELVMEGLVVNTNKKYALSNDIIKLFIHVDNALDKDASQIFYFLMLLWNITD